MAKYQKGDCRYRTKEGFLIVFVKLIKMFLSWMIGLITGKADGKTVYIKAGDGPNRHDRRVEAKRHRVSYNFKGKPGFKILRKMFRKYGYEKVIKLMQGTYRLKSKFIAKTAFYRAMNKTYATAK